MPEHVAPETVKGTGRRILSWPEYSREDPAIFQAVIMDHYDRHSDEGLDLEVRDETLRLEIDEETEDAERLHTYIIDSDGVFTSIVDSDLVEVQPGREVARHTTMTEDRFTALYGRAVKAEEVADYIQSFEQFGVEDTVLERFREGPVLNPSEVEQAIDEAYDDVQAENIPEELYNEIGGVELAGSSYDEAIVSLLEEGETVDGIDTETYTKQRSLEDVERETKYGEEMQRIYDSVMDFVSIRFNK